MEIQANPDVTQQRVSRGGGPHVDMDNPIATVTPRDDGDVVTVYGGRD